MPWDELLASQTPDRLLLTSTRRLARDLRSRYEQAQVAQGRRAWDAPAIHAAQDWLTQTFLPANAPDLICLNEPQRTWLWEEAIRADLGVAAASLLQLGTMARLAMEADSLCVDAAWQPTPAQATTPDQQAFLRWQQQVLAACARQQVTDVGRAREHAFAAAPRAPLAVGEVLLVGFDEPPLWLPRLEQALAARGARLACPPLPQRPQTAVHRLLAEDMGAEVAQAAAWVRQRLEAGDRRVGVVVADLARYQSRIERAFREQLDPGSLLSLDPAEDRFSISLGRSLASQGPVALALDLLRLGPTLTLEQASRLLRTPYLRGSVSEQQARARADVQLRREAGKTLSLASLQKALAAGVYGVRCPVFADLLGRLVYDLGLRRRNSAGAWVQSFSRLLVQLGWPGERPLASDEFQAVKAWKEKLLPALVSLDAVATALSRADAAARLARLAQEQLFQPEAPSGAVQVMGLLEAGGLFFDSLWVLGASDQQLPAPARPQPLLPLAEQRRRGLPHSSPERELHFARQLVQRLGNSAPQVVFSGPAQEEGAEMALSPLLRDLPPLEPSATASPLTLEADEPPLEPLEDSQAPPVAPGRQRGGSRLLRDMLLCPFRALALYRLRAELPETPVLGLDQRLRGTLMHAALETFWQQIATQEQLLALDADGCRQQVEAAIDAAFARELPSGSRYAEALLATERQRMAAVFTEWLALEREREPFAVTAIESRRTVTLNGLDFELRVDRTDRTASDQTLYLDYKTGTVDRKSLYPQTLSEPQLPLYALTEGTCDGVVLARVAPGGCALEGLAARAVGGTGIRAVAELAQRGKLEASDWPTLVDQWRARIHQLVADFAAGDGAVRPHPQLKPCSRCELPGLCRIGEALVPEEEP